MRTKVSSFLKKNKRTQKKKKTQKKRVSEAEGEGERRRLRRPPRRRAACVWLLVVNSRELQHPTPRTSLTTTGPCGKSWPQTSRPEDEGLFAPSVTQRFKSKIFIRFYTFFFFFC